MMQTLIIRELTFEAAHYLPKHPKCGVIHGHTYFVRNLTLTIEEFVDFATIKETVKAYDHGFLIPAEHMIFWQQSTLALERHGIHPPNFIAVHGMPIVENIAAMLQGELEALKGVSQVHFELYEGPNQGVEV